MTTLNFKDNTLLWDPEIFWLVKIQNDLRLCDTQHEECLISKKIKMKMNIQVFDHKALQPIGIK